MEDPNDDKDGDGYTENRGDCDDANPEIYPFAREIGDEMASIAMVSLTSMLSKKIHLFGIKIVMEMFFEVESLVYTEPSCTRPEGYVAFFGDCDDESEYVNPEVVEICDGVDNDQI